MPENIIPLDGSGTTGCHGKIEMHDFETRRALALRLRSDELGYLERKLGSRGAARAWLHRFYHLPEDHDPFDGI